MPRLSRGSSPTAQVRRSPPADRPSPTAPQADCSYRRTRTAPSIAPAVRSRALLESDLQPDGQGMQLIEAPYSELADHEQVFSIKRGFKFHEKCKGIKYCSLLFFFERASGLIAKRFYEIRECRSP